MMILYGEVILPDGRKVIATERYTEEPDVNASNTESLDIEWEDGEPLEAEEYNIKLSTGDYLHEFVSRQLGEMYTPDYEEPDYWV